MGWKQQALFTVIRLSRLSYYASTAYLTYVLRRRWLRSEQKHKDSHTSRLLTHLLFYFSIHLAGGEANSYESGYQVLEARKVSHHAQSHAQKEAQKVYSLRHLRHACTVSFSHALTEAA